MASGQVIGKCHRRHRISEFVKFLDHLEANVAARPDIHIVLDNYATHKTPSREWLASGPGTMCTSFRPASWLNQVERFFAEITEKRIRRGVHRSTRQLENAIRSYIDANNADPKPFRWTKSADDILAAIHRFCQRTLQIGGITESGH